MKTSFVMAHALACLATMLVLVGAPAPGRTQQSASADAGGSASPATENWTMEWEFINRQGNDESSAAEYSAVHVVFGTPPQGKQGGSTWQAHFHPPSIPHVLTDLQFDASVFANATISNLLLDRAKGEAEMIWVYPNGNIGDHKATAQVPPDLTKSASQSNRFLVGNTEFTLYLGLGVQAAVTD